MKGSIKAIFDKREDYGFFSDPLEEHSWASYMKQMSGMMFQSLCLRMKTPTAEAVAAAQDATKQVAADGVDVSPRPRSSNVSR